MPEIDFENWVREIRPKLVRLATRQLDDQHEAEDVVQETLTGIWARLPAGAIQNIDAYTARAVWLNASRRRNRRREWIPLDTESLLSAGFDEPAVHAAVEDQLEAWELERAISNLSQAQQTVVRLHYYSGLSFREIGGALKISMNTAASRCRYALDQLRYALGKR